MQTSFKSFVRQPLLHFVVLGALIFAVYEFSNTEEARLDEKVILVDDSVLLNFMQYRATAFDADLFAARLELMSQEERQVLVDEYVREEALYREALALGLDNGDYIIRQRLVQKLNFLLEDSVTQNLNPSEEDLEQYYQSNLQDYQVDAVYTFTHVYFSTEERGAEPAQALAADALLILNTDQVSFNNAGQYGDRFPFLQNYVERTWDYVRSNFDVSFVNELDSIGTGSDNWHGPFASPYGYHLVMMTSRLAPRIPELEEIQARVLDDYRFEMAVRGRKEAEDNVAARYQVELR